MQLQVTGTTVDQALQRIADITQQAVPAADVVGMSLIGEDDKATTAVSTDPDSPEIDEAQYREDKGPCLDAWRKSTVFRVPRVQDCSDESPAFIAACLRHDVRSTLSLPMRAGEVVLGALDLYSRAEDGFQDESVATDLATGGAAVLLNGPPRGRPWT